jgi:hypothetical protein
MTNPYQSLSIASAVLYGFTMAGVLMLVWIGWLRTRQFGYLVLAAWALATMARMAFSYLPMVQSFLGKPANSDSTFRVIMWSNLLGTIVTAVLLLTGIGLLVFGQRRPSSQPQA